MTKDNDTDNFCRRVFFKNNNDAFGLTLKQEQLPMFYFDKNGKKQKLLEARFEHQAIKEKVINLQGKLTRDTSTKNSMTGQESAGAGNIGMQQQIAKMIDTISENRSELEKAKQKLDTVKVTLADAKQYAELAHNPVQEEEEGELPARKALENLDENDKFDVAKEKEIIEENKKRVEAQIATANQAVIDANLQEETSKATYDEEFKQSKANIEAKNTQIAALKKEKTDEIEKKMEALKNLAKTKPQPPRKPVEVEEPFYVAQTPSKAEVMNLSEPQRAYIAELAAYQAALQKFQDQYAQKEGEINEFEEAKNTEIEQLTAQIETIKKSMVPLKTANEKAQTALRIAQEEQQKLKQEQELKSAQEETEPFYSKKKETLDKLTFTFTNSGAADAPGAADLKLNILSAHLDSTKMSTYDNEQETDYYKKRFESLQLKKHIHTHFSESGNDNDYLFVVGDLNLKLSELRGQEGEAIKTGEKKKTGEPYKNVFETESYLKSTFTSSNPPDNDDSVLKKNIESSPKKNELKKFRIFLQASEVLDIIQEDKYQLFLSYGIEENATGTNKNREFGFTNAQVEKGNDPRGYNTDNIVSFALEQDKLMRFSEPLITTHVDLIPNEILIRPGDPFYPCFKTSILSQIKKKKN